MSFNECFQWPPRKEFDCVLTLNVEENVEEKVESIIHPRSIHRRGNDREYLFFKKAFWIIDSIYNFHTSRDFEAAIDRAIERGKKVGLIDFKSITDLHIEDNGRAAYINAVNKTMDLIFQLMQKPGKLTTEILTKLSELAKSVVFQRKKELLKGGSEWVVKAHQEVLDIWESKIRYLGILYNKLLLDQISEHDEL